ncbi:hypothetical protein L7F22_025203 [Adiantum nelumboides]|nr:hypothetical protein [Adiantum nelumboides]
MGFLQAYGFLPPHQEERALEKSLGETSKRGLSTVREGENPYQELCNLLLDDTHQSRRRGHAQREESPPKKKERSKSPIESMEEDVAPRRRRVKRSPTPTKSKRSPCSPPHHQSKKEEKIPRRKRRERGRLLLHLHHLLPLRMKVVAIPQGNHQGEDIEDHMLLGEDKVLVFIQQFDATFGDEGFKESSKLCHVAMHFQKFARGWRASLWANGEAPRTWKNLRASIMKQFLSSDAKDKVLTKWQSLKLTPFESIHKYVDKFLDLHLKASVYKKLDFEKQKQQFCDGLLEDMNEYVNSQRPKTILAVIHHSMVATRINFQQGAKRNLKPMETKEKHEPKGKNHPQNSSKGNSSNNKAKEKGVYKGKNRLTPDEELEQVIEGRPKSPLLLKVHGKIFAADEYSHDLKESFHQKIKEAISISQQKQKAAANKHKRALAFKENDWVLLKFPKACLRHTSGKNPMRHQKYYAKLAKRYYGPFQILKPINEMAYQLKLPSHWLIHNAFQVSLLKPYKGEPPSEAITEDPLEVEDQEQVPQPKSILRHEDKDSSLMATRSEQLNWQEIYLSEDEASAQGTHAVRFLVQQVEKAQNNSLLRPMLNNLMRAHGLQLLNYEPPTQDPTVQEVSNEGNAREERGAHSQDDASSGRSRDSLSFWTDETRVSPNKKDVCSKRLARCSYVKHPIHLLEEPQVELYLRFKTKYANIQISQRCFESMKSFFVQKLRDRYTCCCIVHVKMIFLKEAVNHMQTQSFDLHGSCCMCNCPICLHHDEVVNHGCLAYKNASMSTTSLLESILCLILAEHSFHSYQCLMGTCNACGVGNIQICPREEVEQSKKVSMKFFENIGIGG